MYQSSFGFHSRPFSASPRHDWFFESESAQQIYQSIVRCIERAAGSVMLIGAAGTGKSLMCQLIAHNLRATFSVVVLDSARLCTRRALLQNILFELGLPFRDMEEGELRLSLMDYLKPGANCPNGMLLLVDEAHVLPMRLLEELRMITNLIRNGQPRVRLVLAGNHTLEERFAHPKLESFSQRIATRCYMKPFNRTETADYVRYQLEKAGGAQCGGVIAHDAMQTIYETTEGLPRLINQVCDHALLLAAADGKRIVTSETIRAAWADIQQLPPTWQATANGSREDSSVIEFGELDADNSELKSDDPRETLDNITKATKDALSPIVQVSARAATPRTDARKSSTLDHTETDPSAEIVAEQDPQFAFDGPSDPFAEEFEYEETVADPFPAEQLAAARLAAVAAMQSDVDLIDEELDVDHEGAVVDLALAKHRAIDSTATPVAEEQSEQDKSALAVPSVHQSVLRAGKSSPQGANCDENQASHQPEVAHLPEVTVTFDKKSGHSIFTIGGNKQPASVGSGNVSQVKDSDDKTQHVENKKQAAIVSQETDLHDDRDMIIGIEDVHSPLRVASNTQPDNAKRAKAHRAEYQTLFSRLRNG